MKFNPTAGDKVRVDTQLYEGYSIPYYYDSLIAKLICWGRNREEAISKTLKALDDFQIEGVKTIIPLHKKILQSEKFRKGDLSTRFVDENLKIQK